MYLSTIEPTNSLRFKEAGASKQIFCNRACGAVSPVTTPRVAPGGSGNRGTRAYPGRNGRVSQPRHVTLRAQACLRRIVLLAILVPAPGHAAQFEELELGQEAVGSAAGAGYPLQPESHIVLSAAPAEPSPSSTSSTAATATPRPVARPMEELIVTAQKRSELLRDVPISISVLDANAIALSGLNQVQEVAEYVPNIHLSRSVDLGTRITLRGVGANSRNIGFDTRVGMYLDGVYLGPSPALNYELLDLARIEILRGPQGTLYGKNTVAGAINLVSSPIPEALDVRVSADIGNLEYRQFAGSISIPVNDALSTRFAGSQRRRDGYVDNLFTGAELNEQDVWSYRAQVQYRVNERLNAGLVIDGLDSERLSLLGEALSDTFALAPEPFAPQAREVQFNVDPTEKRDTGGANLTLDYRFDRLRRSFSCFPRPQTGSNI